MKFEFINRAMRMTAQTDQELRILREEFFDIFDPLRHPVPTSALFDNVTTTSAERVMRVMERLQNIPPWVDVNDRA